MQGRRLLCWWGSVSLLVALGGCADLVGYGNYKFDGTTSSTTGAVGGAGGTGGTTAAGGTGGMSCGAPEGCTCVSGQQQDCYDGPAGTKGVGACKAGQQSCTNGVWGPCMGEVVPAAVESCHGQDVNCDGSIVSCPGQIWSKGFVGGPTENETGTGIAADGDGNVVVAGSFDGTIDLGDGTKLKSAGNGDIFLAKLGADGKYVWGKRFGSQFGEVPAGLAVDGSANIVLSGLFGGTIDFGGGVTVTDGNLFLASLKASGGPNWGKSFVGGFGEVHMAVASTGDIVMAGSFFNTVDFGGGPFTSGQADDIFVAKFDSQGGHVWSKHFFSDIPSSIDIANGVAIDNLGNVLLIGATDAGLALGCGPIPAGVFVAKLNPSATCLWNKHFDFNLTTLGIATDNAGNVLVTGALSGKVNLGGRDLSSAGGTDAFVLKLDPQGNHLWSKAFGDKNGQSTNAVTADPSGNVLLTGSLQGANFGGGALVSAGGQDVFLAKLGPDGSYVWSKGFGGAKNEGANAIATDAAGNVLVAGGFASETINFGGADLVCSGGVDAFVAKLEP